MKRTLYFLGVLTICTTTYAQDNIKQIEDFLATQVKNYPINVPDENAGEKFIFPTSDINYEWSQFKTKTGSSLILKNSLVLESKKEDQRVLSVVELPANTENDTFIYGASFCGPKLNESTKLGIIFDYSDNRNYKGIAINKTQFFYFITKDGIISDIKTGLIKNQGTNYNLVMSKTGDKIRFIFNGIEFAKINKVSIKNPFFGVFLEGKGKTEIPSFIYYSEITEIEE